MFRRNEKGFTLVELMIVVVIIGILASIAIPKFAALIGKTKTTEAKQILGQIIQLEKTYYYTADAYEPFSAGADCPKIGFAQPGPPARFTYSFSAVDTIATAQETVDVNNDGDTSDGITLSITNHQDIIAGSNITW